MIPYPILRELILEAFSILPKTSANAIESKVAYLAKQKNLVPTEENRQYFSSEPRLSDADSLNLNQIIWDLITERIITMGTDTLNSEWPWLRLTEFGKSVISSSNKYYDPEGFIANLQSIVPKIDSVIVQYLAEALNCFRQNLFFSASVMCGAAAEKVVLLLLSSMANKESDPKEKKLMTGLLERPNLPKIFEAIERNIKKKIDSEVLPYSVHQGATQHLLSLFEMIRSHRNDAVHPKQGKVTRETIFLSIQSVPIAMKTAYKLIEWFETNK